MKARRQYYVRRFIGGPDATEERFDLVPFAAVVGDTVSEPLYTRLFVADPDGVEVRYAPEPTRRPRRD
jgi:hypothetical protein